MPLWSDIWRRDGFRYSIWKSTWRNYESKMFEYAKGLHDYIKKSMVQHVVELLQRSGMVITLCLPKGKSTVLK